VDDGDVPTVTPVDWPPVDVLPEVEEDEAPPTDRRTRRRESSRRPTTRRRRDFRP
jgi:hypothetical protein